MPHKHGAFRFVFGVQHGLWQKQALIKSKIKTKKKIRLREENISAIMLGFYPEMSIENEIKRPLFTWRLVSFLFSIRFSMSKRVKWCLVFPTALPALFLKGYLRCGRLKSRKKIEKKRNREDRKKEKKDKNERKNKLNNK